MPSMFGEADLDAFQRLRCAFDPHGLANPGKVMPTPRLCGEVPGPYREHPLERAGVAERDSEQMPADGAGRSDRRSSRPPPTLAQRQRRGQDGADPRRRHEARAGACRTSAGRCRARAPSRLDRIIEHNAGDLTATLEAGVPLADAQAHVRGRRPDARARSAAWDRRRRPGLERDDRRHRRDRRQRSAAPPVRHTTRPDPRRDRRAERRLDRPLRRQGDQERRRLRPREAICGLVRDPRADPRRQRAAASAARASARPRSEPPPTPTRLGAAAVALSASPLEFDALDVGLARRPRRPPRALRRPRARAPRPACGAADDRPRPRAGRRSPTTTRRSGSASGPVSARAAGRSSGSPPPPSELPVVLRAADRCGGTLVGRAALGISYVADRARRGRGACAPSWTRREARPCSTRRPRRACAQDPWGGSHRAALALMRSVKARFDPTQTCNPGLFVGGI